MNNNLHIGDKVYCKKGSILNFYGKDDNDTNIFNLNIEDSNMYEIIDITVSFYVNYIYIKVYEDDIETNSLIFLTYNYTRIKENYDNIETFFEKTHYHDTFYSFEDYFLTNNEYRKQKLDKILNLYE